MPSAPHHSASWWRLNATLPNAITAVRIVLIVVFVVLLGRHEDAWAITALGIAGVSDFLDGYLARRLGQTTALGRFLDPAADRLLTVAVVVGLAWRDIVPWWLVGILLARDAVIAIALLWLAWRRLATPTVTFLGKSATAALYVFLPLSYLAYERWDATHTVALWGVVAAAVAYWGSAAQYLAQARRAGSHGVSTP